MVSKCAKLSLHIAIGDTPSEPYHTSAYYELSSFTLFAWYDSSGLTSYNFFYSMPEAGRLQS